jgi:hypothetical protein
MTMTADHETITIELPTPWADRSFLRFKGGV